MTTLKQYLVSFHLGSFGEYSDLYLKTDLMLLTDISENFWEKAHKTYSLDSAWYCTMPGYTWNYMLKYTKCKLETVQSIDIPFLWKVVFEKE